MAQAAYVGARALRLGPQLGHDCRRHAGRELDGQHATGSSSIPGGSLLHQDMARGQHPPALLVRRARVHGRALPQLEELQRVLRGVQIGKAGYLAPHLHQSLLQFRILGLTRLVKGT